VFREAVQFADVLVDEFGGAVVVVEDGEEAVGEGMVELAEADVDCEEELDDVVDEAMEDKVDD